MPTNLFSEYLQEYMKSFETLNDWREEMLNDLEIPITTATAASPREYRVVYDWGITSRRIMGANVSSVWYEEIDPNPSRIATLIVNEEEDEGAWTTP